MCVCIYIYACLYMSIYMSMFKCTQIYTCIHKARERHMKYWKVISGECSWRIDGCLVLYFSSVVLQRENVCGLNQGKWKETGGYVGCLKTKKRRCKKINK